MTLRPERLAARAAYRLGVVDALLSAIQHEEMEAPGIIKDSLEGEKAHRLEELREVGLGEDDFADIRMGTRE